MNNNNRFSYILPDSLKTEVQGEVLIVSINRPAKRNAINDETVLGLERIFSSVPSEIKCAIIRGEGNHFSSGLDLSELTERDTFEGIQHSSMWNRAMDAIGFGKVPVIAILHGACIGGGLELASACHIRVAEASAFYALPEGQRGIFVGAGGSVRLPKIIGIARMTDLMLTGRVYSAEEGNHFGISQYLVSDGDGLEKAIGLAKRISENTSITNYAVTQVLPRIADAASDQALMMETLIAAISQNSPEAKERIKLFLDGKAKKISDKSDIKKLKDN